MLLLARQKSFFPFWAKCYSWSSKVLFSVSQSIILRQITIKIAVSTSKILGTNKQNNAFCLPISDDLLFLECLCWLLGYTSQFSTCLMFLLGFLWAEKLLPLLPTSIQRTRVLENRFWVYTVTTCFLISCLDPLRRFLVNSPEVIPILSNMLLESFVGQ